MMRLRRGTKSLLMGATLLAAGCAARGGTPRPFPTPSAPGSPASAPERPALPLTGPEEAKALVETALDLVGTPYRAGGEAPATGFDCSGFVTWVFSRHGVEVPRTVAAQFETGWHVERPRAPSIGDLVFFRTGRGRASHVGIALGDGRFVHAPSSRGVVRVERLDAPYWARRYLGARRVISDVVAGRPPT